MFAGDEGFELEPGIVRRRSSVPDDRVAEPVVGLRASPEAIHLVGEFQQVKFADKCFTHDIEELVKAANLEVDRGLDIQANPALGLKWQTVKDWNVDVRYQLRSEHEARSLYDAVTDNANGVLPWIKARW